VSNVKPLLLARDEEETASTAECRVLLGEDDIVDCRQVKLLLAKFTDGVRFHVDSAGTLREAGRCLSNNHYDVVLLDLGLPDSSGLDTIQEAHEMSPAVPIIVLTGLDDEDVGVQAIRRGAEDYLVKGPSLEHALVRTMRHAIERRRIQETLQFKNILLSTQQEVSPDGILVVDEKGAILSFNHRFIALWGILPEAIGAQSDELALQLVLDKLVDPQEFLCKVRFLHEHPSETSQDEIVLRDGRTFDRYSAPMHGPDSRYYGRIWYFRDITERKVAEDKVRQAAEEWQHTFDAIADFIFIMDEESRIVKANKAFMQVIGPKVPDFLGRKCYEVMHRLGSRWPGCTFLHSLEDKVSEVSEVDDSVIGVPLLVTTSPIYDDKGKVTGVVHLAKDISQMKKAHREMKEAIEMKSQFISVASHELRTPLTAIKESIEIVNEAAADKLDAEMKGFLDLAKRNIDRLSRLINDILDLQKLEAGKVELHMQELDINEVVKEVRASMAPLAERKNLQLSLSLIDHPPRLRFDKDKITQVLVNLVNNAVKFTETGSITIAARREGDAVVVTVADTGPGIKKEDLPKLFQKFQQLESPSRRKTGGTGLGLAICKQIVEKHTGKIWVDSEVGVGTRFSFLLPAEPVKVSDGKKNTVVDDEPDVLTVTVTMKGGQ